jgi:acyl carrier protein
MNNASWMELTAVFRDVLGDSKLELTETTSAADVTGWDSITHVLLIASIEKKFKVKFTSTEIRQLANAGDLFRLLEGKLGRKS